MMCRQNRQLTDAIKALPAGAIPASLTGVDVAHALSTMSSADIAATLERPGLEAALQEVFDGGAGATRDTGEAAVGKRKIVL